MEYIKFYFCSEYVFSTFNIDATVLLSGKYLKTNRFWVDLNRQNSKEEKIMRTKQVRDLLKRRIEQVETNRFN